MTVVLSPKFRALRFPGYFWNTENLHLYSCKRGTLRKLAKNTNWYTLKYAGCPTYAISVNGKPKVLLERVLCTSTYYFQTQTLDNDIIEKFPEED